MSTRCLMGADTESGIKAVYVHSDGYADGEHGVINVLRGLVATHGLNRVVSTLLRKDSPWDMFADWTPRPEYTWYFTDQYEIVPGFGVRFDVAGRYFTTSDRIPWDIEYVYVIQTDGTLRWAHKGVTKGDRTWRTQQWQEISL